jgi:hypothetical protein
MNWVFLNPGITDLRGKVQRELSKNALNARFLRVKAAI